MCLSLNQSVALMPSCIDVTILCRNNINQYSLYASKLSAGTIFIKGQYSSQYMAQKRNRSIFHFKLKYTSIFITARVTILRIILCIIFPIESCSKTLSFSPQCFIPKFYDHMYMSCFYL